MDFTCGKLAGKVTNHNHLTVAQDSGQKSMQVAKLLDCDYMTTGWCIDQNFNGSLLLPLIQQRWCCKFELSLAIVQI